MVRVYRSGFANAAAYSICSRRSYRALLLLLLPVLVRVPGNPRVTPCSYRTAVHTRTRTAWREGMLLRGIVRVRVYDEYTVELGRKAHVPYPFIWLIRILGVT